MVTTSMLSPMAHPPVIGLLLEFHHFLIIVLHYETAAPGNLRILDCVFHPNDFIEGTTVRDERHIVEVEKSSVSGYN